MDAYQSYIHKSRYARYIPEEKRRESWDETVARYLNFFDSRGQLDPKTKEQLREAITNMDVMPSMRAMMTAGEALERDNVAGFNCSYIAIDHPRAFDELMFILLCGTGVGFSVERQYVGKLPEVAETFHETDSVVHIADSKIGWAKGLKELITLLYSGQVPTWDVSKVRPSGAPLKTFGGRASGPEPLVELFAFTVDLFRGAHGRKLTSIEAHDLCCKIAEVVVVGGVRRSALISLSNLSDDRIKRAKHGQWWLDTPYRGLANNSVAYTEKPDFQAFQAEWSSLYESHSGERGMFSRPASQRQAAKNGRRDPNHEFGTNPCSEIILRPNQFCNLSEVVARPGDSTDDLHRKCRLAAILGTLQSTLTDFRYLRPIWKRNTEEECLLGVSITGILDHKVLGDAKNPNLPGILEDAKAIVVKTNATWAKKLGVNQSTATTCVKPSGTVSQLVNSSSGIHGRFSPYYIRRVRASIDDPMTKVLEDAGVESELDITNPKTRVFSFPHKSPKSSTMSSDQTGIEQLELWNVYQESWCEHKPSITVYYRDDEFLQIGQWLYNNFDEVSGVSFLPLSDHTYQQAPYEAISKVSYDTLIKSHPKEFDWDVTEHTDVTEGAQQLACVAGVCEI